MVSKKRLIVLGCSATKLPVQGLLPAISLYDGPMYRVLRSYLRDYRWPELLSVGVLSAKHGLIGGVSQIKNYDQRMTTLRADELSSEVNSTLWDWRGAHKHVDFVLGQDYVRSIDRAQVEKRYGNVEVVEGGIGVKLHRLHDLLREVGTAPRPKRPMIRRDTPLYFLPDWDDFIDAKFDYVKDKFSAENRSDRNEKHPITLMRPKRLCDGILVSLAQHLGSKGLLKRVKLSDPTALAPQSVRDHFGLDDNQWAFGDCGAFSYVAEDEPTVSVEQAVALYDLYEFDLGASVDHIPVTQVPSSDGMRTLSEYERRKRLTLTRDNAANFIQVHKVRGAKFTPVGVVQGLGPKSYANQVGEYLDMGYDHLALGGLVPRSDADIKAIVEAVDKALPNHERRPWVHLLGIFRPALQSFFKQVGIGSFDSASYFRKSWLRSDQNYLGSDGQWYAAIRVPPLSDPRTRERLQECNMSPVKLARLETAALTKLRDYAGGTASVNEALQAVLAYDRLLSRAELIEDKLVDAYRETLIARPWAQCDCPMCKKLGIDILIFRGKNRNKSRGAHNTLMLYGKVTNQQTEQ